MPSLSPVDARLDEFDQAWESGSPPDIGEVLQGVGDVDGAAHLELVTGLVLIDLERRWRTNSPEKPAPTVEEYLQRFPELRGVPIEELVVEEYRVRQRFGDRPGIPEYAERYGDEITKPLQRVRDDLQAEGHAEPVRRSDTTVSPGSMITMDFVQRVVESGVLSAEEVETCQKAARKPLKTGEDLAKSLVRQKKLTKFQAQMIYSGKGPGLVLGNYVVLEKIGAGGMGQVFKAVHRRMDRIVALKVLPRALVKDADANLRFQREVKAAARLSHPNIVTAYDAGQHGKTHFFVMEYVDGIDLSALVKTFGPLSVENAVNYVLQAAGGLQYAHEEGVIHRDVKPSNLLIDRKGRVRVLDMGLARVENASAELTSTGDVMGTVDYMSPEQATGTKNADARSDVYSLGCTLYYLLQGKAPYGGDTMVSRIMAHRDKPIPPLAKGCNDVPGTLEMVFNRMLAKKADERYPSICEAAAALRNCGVKTAAIVGDDNQPVDPELQIFFENREEDADGSRIIRRPQQEETKRPGMMADTKTGTQRPSRTQRTRLESCRKLWWTTGIAGAITLAIVLAVIIFRVKTPEGTIVLKLNQEAAAGAVVTVDGNKTITIKSGTSDETFEITADGKEHTLKITHPSFTTYTKKFVAKSKGKQIFEVTLAPSKAVAGKETSKPALEKPKVAPHGNDDPKKRGSSEVRRFAGHDGHVLCATVSPNGKYVVSSGTDKTIRLWELETGKELRRFTGHADHIAWVQFTRDGRRILSASKDHSARLWNAENAKQLARFVGHTSQVFRNVPMPDGKHALSCSFDGTLRLWDLMTGKMVRAFQKQPFWLRSVAVSPDGRVAVTGGKPNSPQIWSIEAGKPIGQLQGHTNQATAVAFSPSGKTIASGSYDLTVRLWDAETKKEIQTLRGHANAVLDVAFSPDGTQVASASNDGTVRVWDVSSGRELVQFSGRTNLVTSVAFTPNGKFVLSAGDDSTVRLWRLPTPANKPPKAKPPVTEPSKSIPSVLGTAQFGLAIGPDGTVFAASRLQNCVFRYDGKTGKLIGRCANTPSLLSPHGLAIGPDGKLYVASERKDCVLRYDATSGRFLDVFVANVRHPVGLTFGPDGHLYVSSWRTHSVLRFDGKTRRSLGAFVTSGSGGLHRPTGLTFGPKGDLFVCSEGTHRVLQYSGKTGLPRRNGEINVFHPEFLAFGPDGRLYVSNHSGAVVRCDVASRQIVDGLAEIQSSSGLVFGPGGDLFVNENKTGRILRFAAKSMELVEVFNLERIKTNGPNAPGAALFSDEQPKPGLVKGFADFGLAFGLDGTLFASSRALNRVVRYDAKTGNVAGRCATSSSLSSPHALTIGPDKNLYVVSESQDCILRYDAKTGAFLDVFVTNIPHPVGLAFGADGNLYISSVTTHCVLRFDGKTGKPRGEIVTAGSGGLSNPTGLAFGPTGDLFVSSQRNDRVLRYSKSGASLGTFASGGGLNAPNFLVFSPHGDLYVSSRTEVLRYDKAGQLLDTIRVAKGPTGLAFGPDGNLYVAVERSGKIKRYDPRTKRLSTVTASAEGRLPEKDSPKRKPPQRIIPEQMIRGHTGYVMSAVFSPDGNLFASGDQGAMIRLWDAKTGKLVRLCRGHRSTVRALAFSPDGRYLLSGGGDTRTDQRTLRLWNVKTGKQIPRFRHSESIASVAFSPNGKLAASAGVHLILWNAKTGKEIRRLVGHSSADVRSVAFSPDGKFVISGGADATVRLWSIKDGTSIQTLSGHGSCVQGAIMTRDGRFLLTGSYDATLRLWNVESRATVLRFVGHKSLVWCIALSADGRFALSGSSGDGLRPNATAERVRLWDVQTGHQIAALEGHTAWVRSVAFSPDGSRAVTAGSDGTVRLWRLPKTKSDQ